MATGTSTSTQIRNFYSDGISYMNVSFYNIRLSFKFYPYTGKGNDGLSVYDLKNGQNTTVDYEGASALSQIIEDIINGKIQECDLPIPCAAGATLKLHRGMGNEGKIETVFSINKNGVEIPFVFKTMSYQVKENGQFVTRIIECGLKAFQKVLEGYLTGINADRHLDKLTDDYVKAQGNNNNNGGNQNNGNNNGNYRNNNYRKNNYNNYKKPYNGNNNGGNYNGNSNWEPPKQQQNLSSYSINN